LIAGAGKSELNQAIGKTRRKH